MWSLTPGSQGCYDEFVVKYVMHSGFEFCGRDWSAYNVADLMRNSHEFLSPQDGSPLKSDASFDGRFLDFLCEIRTNFWVHETWIRTAAFWNRMRPSMVARQFCGCLTTFSLFVRPCERLAKSSTFISRTAHGSYFWCQQGFKLCSHQTNEVLSYDFLTTNSRSRIAEEIADIIRDARKP